MNTIYGIIYGLLISVVTFVGSVLGTIEPSIAIWMISIGGALLTSNFGKDKNLQTVIFHIIMGLFWGIFGSQFVHYMYPLLPQTVVAFFLSIFGVEMFWFFVRNFRDTDFSKIVEWLVDAIFSKLPQAKK